MNIDELTYPQLLRALRGLQDIHARRERWNEAHKVAYGQICKRLNRYGEEG